jgi:hypothetical protein
MIIFGSFLPSLWLVGTTKAYSGLGADIVMESITLTIRQIPWIKSRSNVSAAELVQERGSQAASARGSGLAFQWLVFKSRVMMRFSLTYTIWLLRAHLDRLQESMMQFTGGMLILYPGYFLSAPAFCQSHSNQEHCSRDAIAAVSPIGISESQLD